MSDDVRLPESIDNEEQLEDLLSRPSEPLEQDLAALDGDFILLGAAGTMGPSVARMLQRALPDRRVTAVSRFSDPRVEEKR